MGLDNDEAGSQEVEVNQRALVNILSRYPGTFDVLRELIQNGDDAEAHNIEVHFQTTEAQSASKFDVSKLTVCKWIIKNNGKLFEKEDWERLGKIADGNKDSTKVGAFGVGFYSVLSKSDCPLVRSQGKLLQFHRGKDGKLRMRSGDCSADTWTSVELELRRPEPLPVLVDLTRFLVSSVAFLTNITTISVHLDSLVQPVLHIQKQLQEPVDIPISRYLKPTTPSQILAVESIQRTAQRIVVDAADWAFASSSMSATCVDDTADNLVERPGRSEEDRQPRTFRFADAKLEENAITHDLYTAKTRVNLHPDSETKRSIEESMKSLPDTFKCKAVYFNPIQSLTGISNSSSPKAKHLARLFCGSHGIFPENDSGRLFIGQSTNQTTGIGLHISAHFLPTMERGSIDLANGHVEVWNKEVLWVGGLLARIIYEKEMHSFVKFKEDQATHLGLCTMARFAFGPTSPHSKVSHILQDSFFSCCHKPKSPFPVVSEGGVRCASDLQFRQSNKDLLFLKKYLVLHKEVESSQHTQIISRYGIPLFKFGDIVREFESGVTRDALKSFFVWWEDVRRNPPSSPSAKDAREKFCKEFALRGILRSSPSDIAFKKIKHFTFFPLPNDLSPPDTIHIELAQGVPTRDALHCFGWTQLSLLDWLKFACSQARNSVQSSDVGYRILRILVQFALVEDLRAWDEAAELMKNLECIPTNIGLKRPVDSYFDEADVCECLPVARENVFQDIAPTPVAMDRGFDYKYVDQAHIRKVLLSIRVCRMMDWKDMVERLETAASEDSNSRLLLYLVIVLRARLSDGQTGDLKKKKVLYSENRGQVSATELLLPNDDMRRLGLPILALPRGGMTLLQSLVDPTGSFSMEEFIESLGIQKYPTLDKIIKLAASNNPAVQQSALQYLLSNLETRYNAYKPEDFRDDAFIPTTIGSLARLNEVFASPIWEKLGFKQAAETLRRDLSRLGVKEDPSVDTIIQCFKTPERRPSDINTAAVWFELLYQHGKLPVLKMRDDLSKIPFVPVKSTGSSPATSDTEYLCPKDCFITSTDTKDHYRRIFPFVDFGSNGNSFLESCCAKKSPDASDIVRKILENPQGYLEALGSSDLYLEDLCTIASRLESISDEDKQLMKKAAMFPAFLNGTLGEKLLPADQILISDWGSRDFGSNVFIAPEKDILQKMYREIGSVFLGKYVRHEICSSGQKAEGDLAFNREQVIWRIRCFMKRRDNSGRTDVLFDEQDSNKLRVKGCRNLKLKKIFAPPFGASDETDHTHVKAGLMFDEDDGTHTLYMVGDPSESVALRNDIAVALCHVLLKTCGPNDVLLLASLFAMEDKNLTDFYGSDVTSASPGAPDVKAKPKKVKVEFALPLFLAKRVGIPKTRGWRLVNKKTTSTEDGVDRAITSWGGSRPNFKTHDFSALSAHPDKKKHNNKCKQVHGIMLKKRKDLRDEKTQIQFFLARDAKCKQPPEVALKEFAGLISELARVFGREDASEVCYIFWHDADDDLMAFNRDQNSIYLNLAHYYKIFHMERAEWKDVVTDWYLILAHEIAHNVTMDHDEEHGSISARLAIKYLSDLHARFPCFIENGPLPQIA